MVLTKEQFKEIILLYKKNVTEIDKFSDLGVDIFESHLVQNYEIIFDKLIKCCFNKEGREMLYWWLYEKDITPLPNFKLPVNTIDELWDNYLKDNVI